jgi:hypothetical protein
MRCARSHQKTVAAVAAGIAAGRRKAVGTAAQTGRMGERGATHHPITGPTTAMRRAAPAHPVGRARDEGGDP